MEFNKRKARIIVNALEYYLGKPLRAEESVELFQLIEKFTVGCVNFEISKREKEILLKALNNYRKRFLRMHTTPNINQPIKETQRNIPVDTSLGRNSLAKKWVLPDIP